MEIQDAGRIRLKVKELNLIIDKLESEHYKNALANREQYIFRINQKRFLPVKWILKLKTPEAPAPTWKNDQSRRALLELLESEKPDLLTLAAQLNLYTLNVAIMLTRLNADKKEIDKAEEVRQFSERIRANAQINK